MILFLQDVKEEATKVKDLPRVFHPRPTLPRLKERLCCGHPFHRSVYQGEGVVEKGDRDVFGGICTWPSCILLVTSQT